MLNFRRLKRKTKIKFKDRLIAKRLKILNYQLFKALKVQNTFRSLKESLTLTASPLSRLWHVPKPTKNILSSIHVITVNYDVTNETR